MGLPGEAYSWFRAFRHDAGGAAIARHRRRDCHVLFRSSCIASTAPGQLLEHNGYPHVLHFSGGLQEWEQAGYPVEGEWVKKADDVDSALFH